MHDNLLLLAPEAVDNFLALCGQNPDKAMDTASSTKGATATGQTNYTLTGGVAVIPVEGALDRHARFGMFSGTRYATGYDEIMMAVDQALADPRARAILLSINSPGGVVAGCKELADHISLAAQAKPMAAYADGLMASAAYWLGAATGRVYAPRTASVGSIGVVMVHADMSKAHEKAGVRVTYITGGTFKAAGNEGGPLSDADRQYLEARIHTLHGIFRADVAAHLGLDMDKADAWGDGQVFVDSEARAQGLVTHTVSGLSEAINRLGQEVEMDKTQFAAQHPDLLAELEKDAAAAQASAVDAAKIEAAASARADVLGWVEQLAGAEMRGKIESVMQAGVTPAQFQAVAAIVQQPAVEAASGEQAGDAVKAQILAGIEAATPAAVDTLAQGGAKTDETRAAVERMGNL